MQRVREPSDRKTLSRIRSEAPTRFARRIRRNTIVAVAAVLIVLISMFIVRHGDVGDIERAVFVAFNGLTDALKTPLWIVQLLGSLGFVVLSALAALALGRTRLGVALAVAVPLKLVVERSVIKEIVERERPFGTVSDAIIRDANTSAIGFPSGHAILAVALAGLLAPYLGRNGKIIVYALAALNCIARVYLGAHNPLDVVAGAAAGVAIAAVLSIAVGEPTG